MAKRAYNKSSSKNGGEARVVEAVGSASSNKDPDLAARKEAAMVKAIEEGRAEGLSNEELRERIREAAASVTE